MAQRKRKTDQHIMPVRRDLDFKLPAGRITDWNGGGGPHITTFMNTLSVLFPVGERFFIHSVRHYRDQVTDPQLRQAVTAFIGQEAMHGREHEDYNDAFFAAVPEAEAMESFVAGLLQFGKDHFPKSFQLSITIALEHFTAIMADGLLADDSLLEDAEPHFARLWRWHALEETEHKAVAYDVWQAVMGSGPRAYAERAGGQIVASVLLWAIVFAHFLNFLRVRGELGDASGWRRFVSYTLTGKGYLRKLALPWLQYFKPGFHPWDQDNSHYLAEMDQFVAAVEAA